MSEERSPLLRASGVVVSAQGVVLVAGLVRGVAAARLVAPAEFGVFVVAAAFLGFLELATQPGLNDAVVAASRRPSNRVLRTVWSLNLLRGLILTALLFLLAPTMAALVAIPAAVPAIQVVAVAPLLRSLQSLQPVLDQRQGRLGPMAAVTSAGALSGLVGTIIGGLVIPSAAGLAIGFGTEAFARLVVSFARRGFTPGLSADVAGTRHLFRFASWRFGSNLVTYAAMNVDDLVVGRLAGAAPAGGYRLGYRLSSAATADFPYVLGQVMFPTFRRIAARGRGELSSAYCMYAGSVVLVAAVLGATAVPVAPYLIVFLLGPEYIFIVGAFSIFLAGGLVRAVLSSAVPLFLGAGIPRSETAMQGMRLVVLLLGLAALAPRFGLTGAAWASTLSAVAALGPWATGLSRLAVDRGMVITSMLRRLVPAALSALIATLVVRLMPNLAGAAAGLAFGLTSAGLYMKFVDRRLLGDVRDLLRLNPMEEERDDAE
jgi:O-antigen/teichoic acid export membrane protein